VVTEGCPSLREQPLLGKTPDTTSMRGCEMSEGVTENVFITTIVESVLSQDEKKLGAAYFSFAKDIRKR
jgi:hypothetical protein